MTDEIRNEAENTMETAVTPDAAILPAQTEQNDAPIADWRDFPSGSRTLAGGHGESCVAQGTCADACQMADGTLLAGGCKLLSATDL